MRFGLAGAGRIGTGHAEILTGIPEVSSVVIADVDVARARGLARKLGAESAESAESLDDLFGSGLDALVVAAATDAHADLVLRAVAAGVPVFCEKPVAPDLDGTFQVVSEARRSGVPVQIGFQRRFDAGIVAVRDAARAGDLGWIHTIRSCTLDPEPPHREYIPTSGGLFRDCAVHDIDAIRFVTGHEVVSVAAAGANRGDEFFREHGDIDTGSAILTLDDGVLALVSCTRYNGAGYDVRLEAFGSRGSAVAGLDDRAPLAPAGPGLRPAGPPHTTFLERFAGAYRAELAAFARVAAGAAASPCPPEDGLEAFYVAEACERARGSQRTVSMAEVRR